MERSKKFKFRKTTRGVVYLRFKKNYRVKFKEIVECTEEDLGNRADQFEKVVEGKPLRRNTDQPKEKVIVPDVPKEESQDDETYTIEHVAAGWYNVISAAGKVMNESKLRSPDAEELKSQLEADSGEE